MAWYRCGGGGIPSSLKTGMNDVLNKKFGTSTTYAPNTWPDNINLMGPLPEKTVSGAIASFSDGADVPIKSLVCNVDANLSGVSSVDVVHCGGNIFSSEWEQGSINTSGNNQTNSNVIRTAGFIRVFEGIHYSFTRDITTDIINFRGYDAEQNYIGSGSTILNLITGYSVTNPMRAGDSTCTIEIKAGSGVAYIRMNDYSNDLSVKYTMCVGDTPLSQYSPYVSTTHTAQLGRTIYGGSKDVVNGTGTITWKETTVSELSWTYNSTYARFGATISDLQPASGTRLLSIYSDNYQTIDDGRAIENVPNKSIYGGTTTTIYIKDSTFNDADTFKETMGATKILYPIATPEDFTFTPTPINTFLGDNTLWADTGDISDCTYRADIALALGGGS